MKVSECIRCLVLQHDTLFMLIFCILVWRLTSRDNPHCPEISVIPKLVVGIAVIISCCVGLVFNLGSFCLTESYSPPIGCALLSALGTIAGIIIGLAGRPLIEDKSSFVVAPVQNPNLPNHPFLHLGFS